MSLYGTSLYGESYYGDGDNNNLLWRFSVDWENRGWFGGANEGPQLINLFTRMGRETNIKTDGTGFETVSIADGYAVLDNSDGRYSTRNIHSPLYPNVKRGKKLLITVGDGTAGAIYPIFMGKITDIQPDTSDGERVRITFVGAIQALENQTLNLAMLLNQRVDDLFEAILAGIDWPTSQGTSIDSSLDIQPQWFGSGKSVLGELSNLAEAHFGTFFVNESGVASYFNRSHSATPLMTITEAELNRDISIPQPWESIWNKIIFDVYPRSYVNSTAVWTMGEPVEIGLGETKEIWADYTYNGEKAPVANVLLGTFAGNVSSDGTGENISAGLVKTVEDFGTIGKITITNNSSRSGWVTAGSLIGTAYYCTGSIKIVKEDTATIEEYEETKEFQINNPLIQDANWARDYCDFLKTVLPNGFEPVAGYVEGRPSIQFGLGLFSRVTLNLEKNNINDVYAVGYIEHAWQVETGQHVRTKFIFEPLPLTQSGVWSFPVQIGVNSIFGL